MKEGILGYEMCTIRTLKFDGTPQEIPVTNLYADNKYNTTSGDDGEQISRFDWITVQIEGNLKTVQLMTLLELNYPSKDDLTKDTIYFFIAADTERIKKNFDPR